MKKKRIIFTILFIFLIIVFLYTENKSICVTRLTYASKAVPASFDGYKVLQLSDLHGKYFGKKQKNLVDKIKNQKPDLILFTGDLLDSKDKNTDPGKILLQELVKIAPVYYVTGNHEWWSGNFDILEKDLLDIGVKVMRNKAEAIYAGQNQIVVLGVDDPAAGIEMQETIRQLMNNVGGFSMLLSHRPELFPVYARHHINLTFSGHAHGGQFRLPFIGGFVAPDQGFFPKYTSGIYHINQSSMVVSRGLGNSIIPQRLFNRPEIVVVTLSKQ